MAKNSTRFNNTLVVVMVNANCHAGTCHTYSNKYWETNYGEGFAVGYFSRNENELQRKSTFLHEAVGHGFGKLADEYGGWVVTNGDYSSLGKKLTEQQKIGHSMNVDVYNKTPYNWADFIGDQDYSSEGIGAYLGAYTFDEYFCRPTQNSIMRDNTKAAVSFNAPSRRIIWYRINALINGGTFHNDYAEFKAWDRDNQDEASVKVWEAPLLETRSSSGEFVHTPPQYHVGYWKDGIFVEE